METVFIGSVSDFMNFKLNGTLSEKSEIPADAKLPLKQGEFRIRVFHEEETGFDHVALTLGDMGGPDPTLVRLHSECLTGDAFGSLRCDCGPQLENALDTIKSNGWGCLLYLRQEGRGIGLHSKIQAYNLQDKGFDTLEANLELGLPADARDYELAAEILRAIGVEEVCLLTNNPNKVNQLRKYNIKVVERMPLVVGVGEYNRKYLQTKVVKMGHEIDEDEFFEKAKGESESLAGFILELAQALPKMGQVISFNSYQFVIESVDRKRIKRVKVILPKKV